MQHKNTAAQDIERKFREVTGRDIPFKLTFDKVSSEPNGKGAFGMYIMIAVRRSDVDNSKVLFTNHFGKIFHDVAGWAVIYIPLGGGSKPSQWLKYHKWQKD